MINTETLKQDLPAGIVVFFVALPLCLGIALASGAPLFSGLIAGVVGGLIVGALSKSPLGVSGPAAGLAVIVLNSLETLGSFEVFLLAVVLAGAIQMVLGALRAGVLGYFFPTAVIQGMLTGIGLIIVLKQIPHAFGYDSDPTGDMSFQQVDGNNTLSALGQTLDYIDLSVVLVTAVSLAILLIWEKVLMNKSKFFQLVPGPLAAVAFGIAYEAITNAVAPEWSISAAHLVSVPVTESFSEIGSLLVLPDFSAIGNVDVWVIAATMAVVASIETLLCVEATDKMDPLKRVTPTNRELAAQGAGNMVSGLIGGLPITQVIVRSSANIHAGAKSRSSAIFHGLLLMVFVLSAPKLLNMIPLGVLASVLILTGYKLAKPALFKKMWGDGLEQFLPFVVTVAGVVFTDLLTGVGLGLALAIVIILQRNFRNSYVLHLETEDPDDNHHQVRIRLAEEVTFLNKAAIKRALAELPNGTELTLDKSACVYINPDVVELIDDFLASAAARKITVEVI